MGSAPESRDQTSTIKDSPITTIETRTDLTTLYRVIRTCMRPLRPHLVGLKPPNLDGSPRLTNHPNSHYGVTVSEREVQVPSTAQHPLPQVDAATNTQRLWLYDLLPKSISHQKTKQSKWWTHTIYYFAGGGFQAPASAEHWKLTARMAKDLESQHIRVVMVSYPLGPKSPAKNSLPLLRAWLAQVLAETASTNETITLMGDSAGGNVVLTLAFWWSTTLARIISSTKNEHANNNPVEQQQEQNSDHPRQHHDIAHTTTTPSAWRNLTQIVAMSPPCDFRNTNPAIAQAERKDPVLTREITGKAADVWCEGWEESSLTYNHTTPFPSDNATSTLPHHDTGTVPTTNKDVRGGDGTMHSKSDPALSPNLQTSEAWSALRESGLVIDGLVGTADCLGPDAQVFMQRCVKERVPGRWLVWEGQMHCFPLTVCYGLGEGREGYEWVKERVVERLERKGM